MIITTADYINNLHFEYFETYSFQRNVALESFKTRFRQKILGGEAITSEDRELFEQLDIPEVSYPNSIFDEHHQLNASAEKMATISQTDPAASQLIEILQTPVDKEIIYRCIPVYRDAILFYNAQHELINGLNLCFECDSIASIQMDHITTDYKTFDLLHTFLLELGHQIQPRN